MKRTMRPPRFLDHGVALLVAAMLLPAVCGRAGEPRDAARHLPWMKLELGARKFLLGATTSIEISRVPRQQALAKLRNLPAGHAARLPGSEVDVIRTSTSMPFGHHERTVTWIDAASGAVL
ncbi:MAG: hypothetical protein GXP48_03760, partial [Acidobacteria bacterium]|nr:hypothetical protein [Acidobacteriota bacterium]